MLTGSASAGLTDSVSLPNAIASPAPTSTAHSPRVCTHVWSTTETTVSRPQFYGPTVFTLIASRTITTLEDNELAPYPCTKTDTIISSVTYEYHMTFSDGHSSTSISSAEYTIPTTRTELRAPIITRSCGA